MNMKNNLTQHSTFFVSETILPTIHGKFRVRAYSCKTLNICGLGSISGYFLNIHLILCLQQQEQGPDKQS